MWGPWARESIRMAPNWGPLSGKGLGIMPLTDVAIRKAKPRLKPYKMGDAGGLFLLVQPSGGRLWRLKYRIDGKEKKLAIGPYPDIGLADARRRRDEARELVALGRDPSRENGVRKPERTFKREIHLEPSPTNIARSASVTARRLGHPPRPSGVNIFCRSCQDRSGGFLSQRLNLPMCLPLFGASRARASWRAQSERFNWQARFFVTQWRLRG